MGGGAVSGSPEAGTGLRALRTCKALGLNLVCRVSLSRCFVHVSVSLSLDPLPYTLDHSLADVRPVPILTPMFLGTPLHSSGRHRDRGRPVQLQHHVCCQDGVLPGQVQKAQGKKVLHLHHRAAAHQQGRLPGEAGAGARGRQAGGKGTDYFTGRTILCLHACRSHAAAATHQFQRRGNHDRLCATSTHLVPGPAIFSTPLRRRRLPCSPTLSGRPSGYGTCAPTRWRSCCPWQTCRPAERRVQGSMLGWRLEMRPPSGGPVQCSGPVFVLWQW